MGESSLFLLLLLLMAWEESVLPVTRIHFAAPFTLYDDHIRNDDVTLSNESITKSDFFFLFHSIWC